MRNQTFDCLAVASVLGWVVGGAIGCGSSAGSVGDAEEAGQTGNDGSRPARDGGPQQRDTGSDDDATAGDDGGRSAGDSSTGDGESGTGDDDSGSGSSHDGSAGDAAVGTAASGLHTVAGTGGSPGHILDGANQIVKLHGVDRSGTEFACTYQAGGSASDGYPGFFDGLNNQTGVSAIAAWHVNAVRVPLNEDCWLGLNGMPMNDTAAHYQAAIVQWVTLLNKNGMVAIVDLHWAAPGTEVTNSNIGQLPMADADHAPAFWSSVASTFKNNSSVIFDLFNEPYLSSWDCWLKGGAASANCAVDKSNKAYAVAGMATLLQAVRKAGSTNVVMMGGLQYSNNFANWVTEVKSIPTLASPLDGLSLDNVAASWHVYDFNSEGTGCPSQYNGYNSTCNTGAVTAANSNANGVLAAGFPLVIGETGISAYSSSSASHFSASQQTELDNWLDSLLTWTEGQGQSYVAWSWNTDTTPVLISNVDGTPTPNFGVTYKAHLASF